MKYMVVRNNDSLAHYGIKGMKWGVRRYVDENGKLTEAGRKRYSGKRGLGKYLYDTKLSEREKKRGKYLKSWGSLVAGTTAVGLTSGDNVTYVLNGKVHRTTVGGLPFAAQLAVGAATSAATYTGLSYIQKNLQYAYLESGLIGTRRDYEEGLQYLRRQGVRV